MVGWKDNELCRDENLDDASLHFLQKMSKMHSAGLLNYVLPCAEGVDYIFCVEQAR